MTNWKQTVDIKSILGDDPDPPVEVIQAKAKKVVDMFDAKIKEDDRSMDLYEAVGEFDCLSRDEDADADAFNDCLTQLYDACDRDRIWLGL